VKLSEDTKEGILIFSVTMFVVSFFWGAFIASDIRRFPDGCKYETIASRINPGYIIGCELLKRRWK
jgi:hypothetical protein